jgi:hypothetical protein
VNQNDERDNLIQKQYKQKSASSNRKNEMQQVTAHKKE